eukprot:4330395-Heterocapsa_arctica.AAC.1
MMMKARHSEKLKWSCARTLRQMCLRVAALFGEKAMACGQIDDTLIHNSTQMPMTSRRTWSLRRSR